MAQRRATSYQAVPASPAPVVEGFDGAGSQDSEFGGKSFAEEDDFEIDATIARFSPEN